MGAQKLGHPVPESNFVVELNSTVSQSMQPYKPEACLSCSAPLNANSVAARRVTSYCSGVSCFCHSFLDLRSFGRLSTPSRVPSAANRAIFTGPGSSSGCASSASADRQIRCTPTSSPYAATVAVPKINPRLVRSFTFQPLAASTLPTRHDSMQFRLLRRHRRSWQQRQPLRLAPRSAYFHFLEEERWCHDGCRNPRLRRAKRA